MVTRIATTGTDAATVDVAIVGCGPVGALAANLLALEGLSVLAIDREPAPHPQPRAVHLDHEMMRLFQAVGLDAQLAPLMRETEGHLHIGADHGVIRYMGTAGRPKPYGWANDYFFWQPELEAVLRAGLDRFDRATLATSTECTALIQNDDGVTLTLRDSDGERIVRAGWVIGCDGARSFVRRALGIALDDLHFDEPWLVVDAEVDAPVRFPPLTGVPAQADLQRLSVMMCDPARPATIVPGRGNHRRWEFMLLPGEGDVAMMQPAAVASLVAPYLEGVPHRIVRATTYRFHGLVADQWRVGRVLLAGDAAHQTPPFFGQGMCHGMRDVANLAWKLGLIVRGEASERLLDSYQPERDPHVRAVIGAAVRAGQYICMLDPAAAAARDAEMRARAASGTNETAADLIPAIASGVILDGSAGAGERFVQPRLSDGRLLDSAIGAGWRLFTRGTAAPDAPVALRAIDATTLDDGGAILGWLDARGADAVLVRPDNYVFGTGAPVALVAALADRIGLLQSAGDFS
ncbi:bifunctional 3-(3-hydroxy-phenyl)propionate/3-hydroxycinnamic acid hydroxylase [Sphingomonas floccifaciens]|uniref:Bifunctional 3-(3-hydroxy-phenyl)propionate/3-hydroxycinnamic acid hydroxylase n=1 Tax=Sphingomonas floccifaciens TaxID=1844115 RepID=A0ABW4N7Z7_9SPHN